MKINIINELLISDIKIIRFTRFMDNRGFFTETYRMSDFNNHQALGFLKNEKFVQVNESYSHKSVIRGLHFQWNPFMGKLVRTIRGRMVDIVLDIRRGSPTFGKGIMYNMPANLDKDFSEWIWVPPGFAHGNFFTEESQIEYFCTGEYSQGCEAGISPVADDIDWSMCDPVLKCEFDKITVNTQLMTDKDRNGFSLKAWEINENSNNFIFGKC